MGKKKKKKKVGIKGMKVDPAFYMLLNAIDLKCMMEEEGLKEQEQEWKDEDHTAIENYLHRRAVEIGR